MTCISDARVTSHILAPYPLITQVFCWFQAILTHFIQDTPKGVLAKRADPDLMPHNVASDLGLHYFASCSAIFKQKYLTRLTPLKLKMDSSNKYFNIKRVTVYNGWTHGAPYHSNGYVPLRFEGKVVMRMGTQQQQFKSMHKTVHGTLSNKSVFPFYYLAKIKH